MGLHPPLRPLARDVQVRPGQGRHAAGARPRHVARQAQRQRQDVDLHASRRRQVRGRHADHEQGRQVRRRALAGQDDLPERPDVLQRLPATCRATRPTRTRTSTTSRRSRRPTTRRSSSTSSKPFAGFDYFAQLSATTPVPQAKDTGTKYKEHVVSTGPYMFSDYQTGKSFTLVRNHQYDPATDPNRRKALPDKIDVELNVNADDIDNRLMAGDLDVDVAGTGVQAAAQGKILADPTLKANTDSSRPRARTTPDQRRRRAVQQHRLPQGRRVRRRQDRLPARLRRRHRWHDRDQPAAADDPGLPADRPLQLQAEADR